MTGPGEAPAREVLIARHGHALCNERHIISGPNCEGLTDLGRAQAHALGDRLAAAGNVTAIHASTTPRAMETARIVGRILGHQVHAEQDLRVPDPGQAEGRSWREARQDWPTDPDYPTRPLAPQGETWTDYLTRAGRRLDTLLGEHPGGRVLVFGHTETATAMLTVILGTADLGRLKLGLDHCATSTWRTAREWPGVTATRQRWTLTSHNRA